MTSRDTVLSVTTAAGVARSGAGLHAAIIMDGNGRWAKRRGLPRTFGHRAGVQALRRTIQAAPGAGIRCLTVFGFSTETGAGRPQKSRNSWGCCAAMSPAIWTS